MEIKFDNGKIEIIALSIFRLHRWVSQ